MMGEPTDAQLDALRIYSVDRGDDDWKACLLRDWDSDDPGMAINDFGWRILRAMRETHGPKWLEEFELRSPSLWSFPEIDPFLEVQWPRNRDRYPQWHAPALRLAVAQRIWCDEFGYYYLIVAATGQPSIHGGHRGAPDGRFKDLHSAKRAAIADQVGRSA
jgi:hypothetical protein